MYTSVRKIILYCKSSYSCLRISQLAEIRSSKENLAFSTIEGGRKIFNRFLQWIALTPLGALSMTGPGLRGGGPKASIVEMCPMLLLSLNSNNAFLKELLKNKLALVSVEGWREQVTVQFRNINYWLIQFQLLFLSLLCLSSLPLDLATDGFYSSTCFTAFFTRGRGSVAPFFSTTLHPHLICSCLELIAH